jgi:uncharacterized membrane protein (UPF0136 family)
VFSTVNPIQTGSDWFVAKPVLDKSPEWQLTMLVIMSLLALATFIYAGFQARRTGKPDALWICVGAGLATFYEPLGDLFAHVTYHEVNQISFTTAFGFSTPLWILPTYVIFFGATVLALLSVLDREISMRQWMTFFVLSLPGALLFEVPLLKMGSIEYYGANQPVQVFGYPLWMAFANSCTMFVVTTVIHFITRAPVIRQYPFLLALLMPMLVLGANGGAALPLASAINSSTSSTTVNIFAVASMVLATLYVWICGKLLQRTSG